jgi:hypothetical protein
MVRGLHVVLKPCNPKRSFSFTETRQPGRAAGPMHALLNPLSMAVIASSMSPPSLAVAASALLSQGLEGWPLYRDLQAAADVSAAVPCQSEGQAFAHRGLDPARL